MEVNCSVGMKNPRLTGFIVRGDIMSEKFDWGEHNITTEEIIFLIGVLNTTAITPKTIQPGV